MKIYFHVDRWYCQSNHFQRFQNNIELNNLFPRLVYDPMLGQDVISVDTPLSKEIIVDPGTKVDSFRDPRAESGFSQDGGGKNLTVFLTLSLLVPCVQEVSTNFHCILTI